MLKIYAKINHRKALTDKNLFFKSIYAFNNLNSSQRKFHTVRKRKRNRNRKNYDNNYCTRVSVSCTCSVYFYTNFQSWAREAKLTLRDKRQRTYRLLLHMTTQQILGLETRDNATCDDVTNIFLHVRETLLFSFSLKTKKNGHLRTPYLE